MKKMSTSRRDFLRVSAVAGGALGLGIVPGKLAGASRPATGPIQTGPARRLKILVLGGTGFIGPHSVGYALERGHELTLFNRGQSNTDLFPGVEKLIGDRNGDLESLKGRSWDVCFDNNASNIDWVEYSTEFLKDSVDRYFYVSSRSAYSDLSSIPMTAGAPTFTYETAGVEPGAASLPYGLQKALCERQVQKVFPATSTIFRPGLIIGPGDTTDRFTYWPVRIHRGGEVLAPSDGTDPVQIIDVRDLTEWMVRMAEDGHTGVFNGVGPANPRPIAQLLYGIRAVTTAETTFTWVPESFLTEQGIRPYSHMPVWMPPSPGREGFARFDLTPEVERGLTFRPLAVTAKETLDYHFARPLEEQDPLRAGVSPEREAEVLAAWHAANR
ncbi:MAG: NAD-dependent epimerase/dehydratase family protein [Gemmatimonadota bacterium]